MFSSPSTTLHSFTVLEKLGEGSFASVYKVQRIDDGKIYAMKKVKIAQMKDKERDNALNEVRVLASISHPNIVNYKQAFFDDVTQSLCIVMQYADAGDVQKKINQHIKNHTHFSEQQIWQALIQMAKGLRALHEINIFHRDIKCANVFCTKDHKYKLGDLNVSKVAKRGMARTQTGTPYYTSPQVWKDRPYDSKCDIWSLGCVIYEMASLSPPFRASNLKQLYTKIQRGIFQRIPLFYSQDLHEIINLCLKVNPSYRPSTVELLQNTILLRNIPNSQKYSNDVNQTKKINLINTILCPKNLKSLKQALPGAKYEQNFINGNSKDKEREREKSQKQGYQAERNSRERERQKSQRERSQEGNRREYSNSIRRIVSAQNLLQRPNDNKIPPPQQQPQQPQQRLISIGQGAQSPQKLSPYMNPSRRPSSQRLPPPIIFPQANIKKPPISQNRQILNSPPLAPIRESPSRPNPYYNNHYKMYKNNNQSRLPSENRKIVRNNSADVLRNRRESEKSERLAENRSNKSIRSSNSQEKVGNHKNQQNNRYIANENFVQDISNRCKNIKQRVQLIMANRNRQQKLQRLINYQQKRYAIPIPTSNSRERQRERKDNSQRSRNSSKRNSLDVKNREEAVGKIVNIGARRNSSKSLERNNSNKEISNRNGGYNYYRR